MKINDNLNCSCCNSVPLKCEFWKRFCRSGESPNLFPCRFADIGVEGQRGKRAIARRFGSSDRAASVTIEQVYPAFWRSGVCAEARFAPAQKELGREATAR